jgi:DNA-binding NtrC family response regulator
MQPSHPLHLLVLERNAERREALVELLRAAGHRPLEAADANAAAEALRVPGLDLLVLDLGLAELDLAALARAICPTGNAAPDSLDAAERRHIAAMLRHTRGNRRQAALLLGISRSTLLNKLRRYGLDQER